MKEPNVVYVANHGDLVPKADYDAVVAECERLKKTLNMLRKVLAADGSGDVRFIDHLLYIDARDHRLPVKP